MMTLTQQIITIAAVVLATMVTRFLPFLIFPSGKPTPKYIRYLGKVLPAAVFGLLIAYCLKNASIFSGSHGIPEAIAIAVVVLLHLWKRQMLLSIAGGTICYGSISILSSRIPLSFLTEIGFSKACRWLVLAFLSETCNDQHDDRYHIWKHLEDLLGTSRQSRNVKVENIKCSK